MPKLRLAQCIRSIAGTLLGVAVLSCVGGVTEPNGGAPVTARLYVVTPSTLAPVAGASLTVTAQLADSGQKAIALAGRTVTWTATGTGGSFATPTSVTDANGIATIQFTTGTTVGTYVVTATDTATLTGSSAAIASVAGPASAAKSVLTATPTSLPDDGQSKSTITLQAEDANGNALHASGGTVVISATVGTASATTDNANGSYTATITAPTATGSSIVSATLAGAAVASKDTIAITPVLTATQYVITSSTNSPVAGAAVTITAQLASSTGAAVTGVAATGKVVTWHATGAAGTFGTATSTTNASGVATVTYTTAASVGLATVSGTDAGSLTGSLALTSVAGAASAAKSVLTAVPTTLAADGQSKSTITLQAEDANGNLIHVSSGVAVISSASGTVSATTDNANGTYTATVTAPTTIGSSIVSATLAGTALTIRDTLNFTANVASKYVITSSVPSPVAGAQVTITAQLANSSGAALSGAGNVVTWHVTGIAGTFGAPTSTTNASGVATVSYTTSATAGLATISGTDASSLTGSLALTSVAGALSLTKSALTAVPTSIPADGQTKSTITLQAEDANGNFLHASAGTAVISATAGTVSATTDNSNGTYTATVTAPVTTGTSFVSATLGGAPVTSKDTITIVVSAGSQYIVTSNPASPVAGAPVTITAQLANSGGVAVTGAAASGKVVTWHATGLAGVFGAPTSTTDVNGTATVTYTTSATAGLATISGTDAGTLTGSLALTSVAGAGTRYTVNSTSTTPVAGGAVTVTAQLVDANSNPVSLAGQLVTWSVIGETGGSFTPTTSTTSASGAATTSYTTGTSVGISYSVGATDGSSRTGSVSLTNTAGTPASLQWTGASHIVITDTAYSAASFTGQNQFGRAVAPAVTYTSGTTAAATVNGSGLVSPVSRGQTMLVGSATANSTARDSVLFAIATAASPVVHTDLTRFDLKNDTTFTLTVIADMRSATLLGSATVSVVWDPTQLTYVSDADGSSGVGATVNSSNAANGTLVISGASASGFSGSVQLRKITFTAASTVGKTGSLHLLVSDLSVAGTFASLLSTTLAVTTPLILR